MRLADGADRCSGRVELWHHHQWQTVCHDGWDVRDAQVVCRAVDCGPPISATHNSFFGQGEGPVALDDVSCVGNESSLLHCKHKTISGRICSHDEEAGVVCLCTESRTFPTDLNSY